MGCGFCEAALSNSVVTVTVDCVVKPMGHQLDYICCFHDNVEKLMERKYEVTMVRGRLQREIEDARRQLQGIEDVCQLLSKADGMLKDVESFLMEIQQNKMFFNWYPNWSWRYQLSRKATKKTLDSFELLENTRKVGQPRQAGYRATSTLRTLEFPCSKGFVVFESSNRAFNQIIEALCDDNASKIGLCGMGGVGKKTVLREVGNQAKKLNLFNKVVISTVSGPKL